MEERIATLGDGKRLNSAFVELRPFPLEPKGILVRLGAFD